MTLTVLQHATLIDGTGRPPQREMTLVIGAGRIQFVGPDAAWRPPADVAKSVLDCSGRVVIPGLIDCHVHLATEGPPDSKLRGDLSWTTLLMLRHAQNSLAAGITTVRDVGGRHAVEFSVRRAIDEGLWAGPRMALAGKLLSMTSSGADHYEGMYREADGPDEVRKAAREQLKAGADWVKVMATGAVLVPGEHPGAAQYNLEELRAAVEEAGKAGKPVAAHAHGIEGIRNAVAAGARTIEHGTFLNHDERVMALMAERGIYLVPTLKVFYDIVSQNRPGIPNWIQEKAKYALEDNRKSVRRAMEVGVPLAMGSDAASPYNFHGQNAMEVVLMAEAGLSPMQALMAATSNAARALGWGEWLGTLELGKVADLLVLSANPLNDLHSLIDPRTIELVIKGGTVVARPPYVSDRDVPESLLAGAWLCCGVPVRREA